MLAEIEGFAMRRIADPGKAMEQSSVRADTKTAVDQVIEIASRSGISPDAGVRALTRILLSTSPTALVAVPEPIAPADLGVPANSAPSPVLQVTAAPIAAPAAASGSGSVEATLIAWWQELLGVEQVGLDDDFFDLGGHSLIGVRLLAKIKKAYRADLELAVLFEARTVRQLSALIAQTQQPAATTQKTWSTLVPIQPNGSRTPCSAFTPSAATLFSTSSWPEHSGPDQPFYAIRSVLINREEQTKTTVEALASIYVSEMRAFFPQGPYFIGGASYGGLVAFEMAKQLHAQGVPPALLVMFDTSVPDSEEIVPPTARASTLWQNIRQKGLPYLARKAEVKCKYWGEKLERRARIAACAAYHLAGRRLPVNLRYFEIDEAHRRALAHYVFRPSYEGKVTVIRAEDRGP